MKQHYDHSIDLMEKMLVSMDSRENSNKEWDQLFEYMFKHFPSPSTKYCHCVDGHYIFDNVFYAEADLEDEVERCAEIINSNDFVTYANLSTFEPKMFPVAMAKFLLFNFWKELNVEPVQSSTFQEFHKRYGYMMNVAQKQK